MTRGRKPKPTNLRILHGNPGRRPLRTNEPKPTAAIPECPDHLDPEARSEWARLTPELFRLGLLTRIDRAALAAYCSAWSRWVYAEQQLDFEIANPGGGINITESGAQAASPWFGIARRASLLMHRYLVEFGLTPSSRTRVTAAGEPTEGDPAEALLGR